MTVLQRCHTHLRYSTGETALDDVNDRQGLFGSALRESEPWLILDEWLKLFGMMPYLMRAYVGPIGKDLVLPGNFLWCTCWANIHRKGSNVRGHEGVR